MEPIPSFAASESTAEPQDRTQMQKTRPGLKKIPPYWYPYTTMAKGRWLGREILEIVSTEFRDRSMEFYRYALESGITTVNGEIAKPDTIIRNGDRIENVVHRHEPPVTSTPVRILHHDKERGFIVIDKPGSIPVHAVGRYFRNSLVEILKNDFGFEKVYTVNRLDRLTSGLMILPLNATLAATLTDEFVNGRVRKEYIARCKGKFPEEEVVCEEPLLTVDRQMGLNIVHPEGKPAKTIFKRLRYDENTDTSVLHCRPLTGRSHQIRVHLQFLGHPIANDPVYSDPRIWGEKLGKGGIDLTPTEERAAPQAPEQLQVDPASNPESLQKDYAVQKSSNSVNGEEGVSGANSKPKLLPRETGHDIGMGSPVPLSAEAVGIITRLRNMKDEAEDWGRWRDVVFRAKGKLTPHGFRIPLPPQNERKRGGSALATAKAIPHQAAQVHVNQPQQHASPGGESAKTESENVDAEPPRTNQLTLEDITKLSIGTPSISEAPTPSAAPDSPVPASSAPPTFAVPEPVITDAGSRSEDQYCPECYVPLHPDPKPESLYIFLHAIRYTTSLGCFETEMPEWASEGWEWEQ
ncbi:hypothetical protein ONZ51_g10253 [Trametes cubensis]|uniref:Pseudouridine synthase RsuA/RluA-like domain-containing protein n=1 Tax=Trametes cubensis TaxID=1111947 RepID=A0AAD7X6K6_9APHY|nr:hypothetical protein ONZ51_g10253 [Trametes cubensis]